MAVCRLLYCSSMVRIGIMTYCISKSICLSTYVHSLSDNSSFQTRLDSIIEPRTTPNPNPFSFLNLYTATVEVSSKFARRKLNSLPPALVSVAFSDLRKIRISFNHINFNIIKNFEPTGLAPQRAFALIERV